MFLSRSKHLVDAPARQMIQLLPLIRMIPSKWQPDSRASDKEGTEDKGTIGGADFVFSGGGGVISVIKGV